MAGRKGKKKSQSELGVIVDIAHTINDTFEALTGKSVAGWFEEFRQRPRALPGEAPAAPQQEPTMSLARAYAVLGLPPTATMGEVKRNYKNLAVVFHPDKEGGFEEAMKLLNNAYDRVKKEKGER